MDRQLTRKQIQKNRLSRVLRIISIVFVFVLINVLFRSLLRLPNQIKSNRSFFTVNYAEQLSDRKNTVISISIPVNCYLSDLMAFKKISVGSILKLSVTRRPTSLEIEFQVRGLGLSAYAVQKLKSRQIQTDTHITQKPDCNRAFNNS